MLRRRFLILISFIGLAGAFKLGLHKEIGFLFKKNSENKLSDDEEKSLWRLISLINREWPLLDDIQHLEPVFSTFVILKANSSNIYLSQYRLADKIVRNNNEDEIRSILRSGKSEIKKYVVQEFAQFLMVNGGFKQFGLKNYPGHVGGPFALRPYR